MEEATYAVYPALPEGVTLNEATGAIAGATAHFRHFSSYTVIRSVAGAKTKFFFTVASGEYPSFPSPVDKEDPTPAPHHAAAHRCSHDGSYDGSYDRAHVCELGGDRRGDRDRGDCCFSDRPRVLLPQGQEGAADDGSCDAADLMRNKHVFYTNNTSTHHAPSRNPQKASLPAWDCSESRSPASSR